MTIIESFVAQHFAHIYDEICHGIAGQGRAYFNHLPDNKKVHIPKWTINASKEDVLDSICVTLHLLMRAETVDCRFEELRDWANRMLKMACSNSSHSVTSGNTFRVLVNASDPITRYLFSCFNWEYRDTHDFGKRNNFLYNQNWADAEKRVNSSGAYKCFNLLEAMRALRNPGSHLAQKFYGNRIETLQKLVYHLYDFITIVYMIHYVLGYKLSVDVKGKAEAHVSLKKLKICVRCRKAPETVAGIRLYQSNNVLVQPSSAEKDSATYEVQRFADYRVAIKLVDGEESQKSELFTVDEGYVDGSTVEVTMPPQAIDKPKVHIEELLLFTEGDLPDELQDILRTIDRYRGEGQEYVAVARTLIMASATECNSDREKFRDALNQLKANMEQMAPEHLTTYLQEKARLIDERLSLPYREGDCKKLLEQIDHVYDRCFAMLNASPEQCGMSVIDQIDYNVKRFLEGEMLAMGTTVTERQAEIQEELTLLRSVIKLGEKYPDIVQAEFGDRWLSDKAESLYVDSVNQYLEIVIPLRKSTKALCDYVQKYKEDEPEANAKAWLLEKAVQAEAEHTLHFAVFGGDLLIHWVDGCTFRQPDKELENLKKNCRMDLRALRERNDVQMNELYLLPLDAVSISEAQNIFQEIKDRVKHLQEMKDQFALDYDAITKRQLAELKGISGWIEKNIYGQGIAPELKGDVLSNERFNSLVFLLEHCSTKSFLQLLWASDVIGDLLNCKLIISCAGLYGEWYELWTKWDENVRKALSQISMKCRELYKMVNGKQRVRHLADSYESKSDVLRKEVEIVFEHQKKVIERSYIDNDGKTAIPAYIADICDSSAMPTYMKVMMLRWVMNPEVGTICNLILLTTQALDCVGYADFSTTRELYQYITGEYAKQMLAEVLQGSYSQLTPYFKKMFIELLMNRNPIAARDPSVNYCQAYVLNFPKESEGKGVIDTPKFFRNFANYRLSGLHNYEYDVLNAAFVIAGITANYVKSHPKDTEIEVLMRKQISCLQEHCSDFYAKHIKIQEGKKSKDWVSAIYKEKKSEDWVGSIYKAKNDIQRVALLQQMAKDKTAEEMAGIIKSFYIYWAYGSIVVTNEDEIVPTVKAIRELVEKYGDGIEVPFNGKPTGYFDMLLLMHKNKLILNINPSKINVK